MNVTRKIPSLEALCVALALALAIALSFTVALSSGYNSDAIYSYSQAKDIIQFGTLSGWTYSASPFTFPDVILSLPFVLIAISPFNFHLITAPIQLIIFAILFDHSRDSKESKSALAYLAFSIASVFTLFLGTLIFRPPFYFLAEPCFVLVHHGGAVLSAIVIYSRLHKRPLGANWKRNIAYSLAILLLTISDLFFCLYFGSLLLASLWKGFTRNRLMSIALFGLLSAGCLFVSWKYNPSLKVQIHSSTMSDSDAGLSTKIHNFFKILVILIMPAIMLILLKIKKLASEESIDLFFASIIISLFVIFAGLISDVYSYRYLVFIYVVSLIMCAKILATIPSKILLILGFFSLIGVSIAMIHVANQQGRDSEQLYKAEIDCLKKYAPTGSTIAAEYWPAKIIFESTHRKYNLVQLDSRLSRLNWVYNVRWNNIFQSKELVFLVLNNIDQKSIKLPRGRQLCGGKLLAVSHPWD